MRKQLSVSLLLLCLWVAPASAQVAALVYDPANFSQNVISAVQSVITAIQAVLIQANQVLDLTPLDGILASGIGEDMALLGQLVVQAEGLSYDVGSLQTQIESLFNLDTAPDTREGLTVRLEQIKRLKYQCYTYAAKVQTLMQTALRTVDHLQGLLGTLGAIVGNMGGNQTNGQFIAVTGKHLANLDVQMASFQRAQTVDKLSEALIIESINRIQAKRMEDWPSF